MTPGTILDERVIVLGGTPQELALGTGEGTPVQVFVSFPAQDSAKGSVTVRLLAGVTKAGFNVAPQAAGGTALVVQILPESLLLDHPATMTNTAVRPYTLTSDKMEVVTAKVADDAWTEVGDATMGGGGWNGEVTGGGLWAFGYPPGSGGLDAYLAGDISCRTDGSQTSGGERLYLRLQGSSFELLRVFPTGCTRSDTGDLGQDGSTGLLVLEPQSPPTCGGCSASLACDCPPESPSAQYLLNPGPGPMLFISGSGIDCGGDDGWMPIGPFTCASDADCGSPSVVCRDGACVPAGTCAADGGAGSDAGTDAGSDAGSDQ
jgi:hypothetical protein